MSQRFFSQISGVELKPVLSSNCSQTIATGKAFRLTCRRKNDNDDNSSFSNITWHWKPAKNASKTLEFNESVTSFRLPSGAKIQTQKQNGFRLSHLFWQNISTEAAGTYTCSHNKSEFSISYIVAVSCIIHYLLTKNELMYYNLSFTSAAAGVQHRNNAGLLVCGGQQLSSTEVTWLVLYTVFFFSLN